MEEPADFFAIGDVVIDDFIRLKQASVHCRIDHEECEICMRWGDKIPFEFSMRIAGVGNSPNAAVSAARLGLTSGLRSYVGDDEFGQECLAALKENQVDTTYIEKVTGKHTNYHYVLWFESERTILIKHETFEYTVPTFVHPPRWLYLSSLAENFLPYQQAITEALKGWPDTQVAFQPGTFQIKAGVEQMREVYAKSAIFFCNKEEAEQILDTHPSEDMKALLTGIQNLGPRIAVITNDRQGAYAADAEGHFYYIPMYPDVRPPYERTGAGDAFSSTVVAALALGKPLREALLWGPINAMSVVQEVGAQKGLLTREKLEAYLHDAPKEYVIGDL